MKSVACDVGGAQSEDCASNAWHSHQIEPRQYHIFHSSESRSQIAPLSLSLSLSIISSILSPVYHKYNARTVPLDTARRNC
jgi:hypothetical protein